MTVELETRREPPEVPGPGGSRRLTERVFRVREFGIIAVLVVFVGITAAIQPRFLNLQNIQFVLVDATIFAFLALGETMVIVTRNVDLSIGSVLGCRPSCPRTCSATTKGSRSPSCSSPGWASGSRADLQRPARAGRPGTEPGGDARHPLHHPGHRRPDRRRRPGRRQVTARQRRGPRRRGCAARPWSICSSASTSWTPPAHVTRSCGSRTAPITRARTTSGPARTGCRGPARGCTSGWPRADRCCSSTSCSSRPSTRWTSRTGACRWCTAWRSGRGPPWWSARATTRPARTSSSSSRCCCGQGLRRFRLQQPLLRGR